MVCSLILFISQISLVKKYLISVFLSLSLGIALPFPRPNHPQITKQVEQLTGLPTWYLNHVGHLPGPRLLVPLPFRQQIYGEDPRDLENEPVVSLNKPNDQWIPLLSKEFSQDRTLSSLIKLISSRRILPVLNQV